MGNKIWRMQDKALQIHCDNTEILTERICDALYLPEDMKESICIGAHYHDIGKTQIPEEILYKPGKLTDEEFSIIKNHAEAGYRIAQMFLPEYICQFIRYHHENEDGSGYYGILNANIPLGAKIIHVCDVFDALTTERVYKKSWAVKDALAFLNEKRGTMFEPKIVSTFTSIMY